MSGYQLTRVYGRAGGELQVCVTQDRTGDRPPPRTPHEGKLNLFERHWPLPRHLFKVKKLNIEVHLTRLDTITSARPIVWFRLNLEEEEAMIQQIQIFGKFRL